MVVSILPFVLVVPTSRASLNILTDHIGYRVKQVGGTASPASRISQIIHDASGVYSDVGLSETAGRIQIAQQVYTLTLIETAKNLRLTMLDQDYDGYRFSVIVKPLLITSYIDVLANWVDSYLCLGYAQDQIEALYTSLTQANLIDKPLAIYLEDGDDTYPAIRAMSEFFNVQTYDADIVPNLVSLMPTSPDATIADGYVLDAPATSSSSADAAGHAS